MIAVVREHGTPALLNPRHITYIRPYTKQGDIPCDPPCVQVYLTTGEQITVRGTVAELQKTLTAARAASEVL